MFTCFLFAEHFDDEYCLSLRLNEAGKVDSVLMRRSIDELRLLQANSKTILVLPTRIGGFYEVELAWVGDSKARAVLPYALEDKLAEPVAILHFSFDRYYHQINRYLVVVISKQILTDWMSKLDRLNLAFDSITLDWFALNPGDVVVVENNILVNSDQFKGALSVNLINTFLQTQTIKPLISVFNDSIPITHADTLNPIDSVSYKWISENLFQKKSINLCQGEFQHTLGHNKTRIWYKFAGLLASLSFVGFIMVNLFSLIFLKHHIAVLDEKIAVVYRQFFPESRQIISPRFRIGQLLNKNQSSLNGRMWDLLEKLTYSTVVKDSSKSGPNFIEVQYISFQNQMLLVKLICNDFAELEKLEIRLQQEHLKVHQASTVMQSNRVVATLELT